MTPAANLEQSSRPSHHGQAMPTFSARRDTSPHEQRQSPRMAVSVPAKLEFLTSTGRPASTRTTLESVAREGLGVILSDDLRLRPGNRVSVIFRAAKERFYLGGEVKWTEGHRLGMNLNVEGTRDETRRRWAAWIAKVIRDSGPPLQIESGTRAE